MRRLVAVVIMFVAAVALCIVGVKYARERTESNLENMLTTTGVVENTTEIEETTESNVVNMKKEAFGKVDGKEVYKYTLTGDNVSVDVLDFGATIQSLYVDGINIVQSFETAENYKLRGGYVCGAIGRVANRIAKAKFTLNGQEYLLTKNEGDNQLHGGLQGLSS